MLYNCWRGLGGKLTWITKQRSKRLQEESDKWPYQLSKQCHENLQVKGVLSKGMPISKNNITLCQNQFTEGFILYSDAMDTSNVLVGICNFEVEIWYIRYYWRNPVRYGARITRKESTKLQQGHIALRKISHRIGNEIQVLLGIQLEKRNSQLHVHQRNIQLLQLLKHKLRHAGNKDWENR